MVSMNKVVVTGLGFITSIGNDRKGVVDSLLNLRHGIELYEPFSDANIPINLAATVKGFDTRSVDPEDWVYPDNYRVRRDVLRSLSPHGLYAYCAMKQAIQSAGLDDREVSDEDTGIYTASAGSPGQQYYHTHRMHELGVQRCSPMGIISSIAGTLNFNLVSAYQIKGSSCGFVSACAASGHALGCAFWEIMTGRQKRMFVVGAEDGNYDSILPFACMRALTPSSNPDDASRPFDKKRDGFVGTGGAVVMVLESEESAITRGADIRAEFAGWGQASDGYNVAISHPEGNGLSRAMAQALKHADMRSDEIDYVNAHAPSTTIGDLSEIKAMKRIFSNSRPEISSTKALTGHGLSLSSVMEAGFSVLAMEEGFTPGSAHIEELDEEASDLNIIRQSIAKGPDVVMSNSSGFGGANVSLVFKRHG